MQAEDPTAEELGSVLANQGADISSNSRKATRKTPAITAVIVGIIITTKIGSVRKVNVLFVSLIYVWDVLVV